MFPTISEYNQTISSEGSNAFRTLSSLIFLPSRINPVKIFSYGSGSYAVVFKAKDGYKNCAIRCFISAESENIDRYKKIDSYLRNLDASWITKMQLLQDEIFVGHQYYPVIKMDWVEGKLLNDFIASNINNNIILSDLQQEVVSLSQSLELFQIGHGDIQCGNVIIVVTNEGKIIVKLIDYDGMYIPAFANKLNLERGRTEFQHPNRALISYNEKIDRFSFWVIICAIEAIKHDKTLWLGVMNGGFNTLDNLLFTGDDFKYFSSSSLVKRLYDLKNPSLSFYLNKLKEFCNSSPNNIDSPILFESNAYKKEFEPTSLIPHDSSCSTIDIITNPVGAVVLNQFFQRIGFSPLRLDKLKYIGRTLIISLDSKVMEVHVEQNTTIIELNFDTKANSYTTITELNDNSIVEQNSENSQPRPAELAIDSKKNNSNWLILGVFTIVFISLIITLVSITNQTEPANDLSNENTAIDNNPTVSSNSETNAIVTIDSLSSVQVLTNSVDSPPSILSDTIERETFTDLNVNTGNETACEQTVKRFLEALDNKDCESAWYMTYNPIWEDNGKKWFCSILAYGGFTKVRLNQIYTISQTSNVAEVYVNYYSENLSNGNKCFKQKFRIEYVSIRNSAYGWMITNIEDIELPYVCQ